MRISYWSSDVCSSDLPHTIHWHGLLQKGTWKNDGVPGTTQAAIAPGDTYTYKFVAEPAGTMWYHCHVNVNEHVAMRGMWGPFVIDRKKPLPIEKKVTKDFILMFSDWASKWAFKPGYRSAERRVGKEWVSPCKS